MLKFCSAASSTTLYQHLRSSYGLEKTIYDDERYIDEIKGGPGGTGKGVKPSEVSKTVVVTVVIISIDPIFTTAFTSTL